MGKQDNVISLSSGSSSSAHLNNKKKKQLTDYLIKPAVHAIFDGLGAQREEPHIWRFGSGNPAPMRRNLFTRFFAFLGSLTNIGRINIPAGQRGISYDNGQLVVLGEGNHWLVSPNHRLQGAPISIACPSQGNPFITVSNQVAITYVEPGEVALVTDGRQYKQLTAGRHVLEGQGWRYVRAVKMNEPIMDLGNITVVRVPAGHIAFSKTNAGELRILEAGEHVLKNNKERLAPYGTGNQAVNFVNLSKKLIQMDSYTRVRIEGNECGVFSDPQGKFVIVDQNIHEQHDVNMIFKDCLPLTQMLMSITPEHHFRTTDGAEVSVNFDIYFQIVNPEVAIRALCYPERCINYGDMRKQIEDWIRKLAIDTMASLISCHSTNDVITIPNPKATGKESASDNNPLTNDIREHYMANVNERLRANGIQLDSFTLSSGIHIVCPKAQERITEQVGAASRLQIQATEQTMQDIAQRADNDRLLSKTKTEVEVKRQQTEAKTQRRQAKWQQLEETMGKDAALAFLQTKMWSKSMAGHQGPLFMGGNQMPNLQMMLPVSASA